MKISSSISLISKKANRVKNVSKTTQEKFNKKLDGYQGWQLDPFETQLPEFMNVLDTPALTIYSIKKEKIYITKTTENKLVKIIKIPANMNMAKNISLLISSCSRFLIYICSNELRDNFNIIRLNLESYIFDFILIQNRIESISLGEDGNLFYMIEDSLYKTIKFIDITLKTLVERETYKIVKYYTYDEKIFH